MEKCINCDFYDWELGHCNVEGEKPCEAPVKKSIKENKTVKPVESKSTE